MAEFAHIVFTDGASTGNPGPGGWGVVMALASGDVVELGGSEDPTTNNRMELSAAIEALRFLAGIPGPVIVHTDSAYLIRGITQWLPAWKRRGWRTLDNKPVLNRELWEELERLARRPGLGWKHVAGHAGIPGNERADRIATELARGRELELYGGSEADYPLDLRAPVRPDPGRLARKSRNRGQALAYLSLVHGEWRRHATWAECAARVKGVSGARFQKVLSEAEIPELLRKWGVAGPVG